MKYFSNQDLHIKEILKYVQDLEKYLIDLIFSVTELHMINFAGSCDFASLRIHGKR